MIKKLNIAIAIVFIVMIGLKMALSLRNTASSSAAPTEIVQEGSTLEPVFYYSWWPPYFAVDAVTRRNGFVLDQIKAIFPRAKFVCLGYGDETEDVCGLTLKNPRGVTFTVVGTDSISEFVASSNSIASIVLRIMTRRSNPWKYSNGDSLKRLNLCVIRELASLPLVKGLIASGTCRLMNESTEDVYGRLVRGEIDGCIVPTSLTDEDEDSEGYSIAFEELRMSAPIFMSDLILQVNNADPEFARAVIRDYEEGLRRIKDNGQLQRIREYYGF